MTHCKIELHKRDPALTMCTRVFQLKVHSTLEGKTMLRQFFVLFFFLNLQTIIVAFAVSHLFMMIQLDRLREAKPTKRR